MFKVFYTVVIKTFERKANYLELIILLLVIVIIVLAIIIVILIEYLIKTIESKKQLNEIVSLVNIH